MKGLEDKYCSWRNVNFKHAPQHMRVTATMRSSDELFPARSNCVFGGWGGIVADVAVRFRSGVLLLSALTTLARGIPHLLAGTMLETKE